MHIQKLKRGTEKNGLLFWGYNATSRNGERWLTPDAYDIATQKQRDKKLRFQATEKYKLGAAKYRELNRERLAALERARRKNKKACSSQPLA